MEQIEMGGRNGKLNRKRRKLIFWNIAGLGNKDKEFWKYVKGFDFVSLSETWVDEKGWGK